MNQKKRLNLFVESQFRVFSVRSVCSVVTPSKTAQKTNTEKTTTKKRKKHP